MRKISVCMATYNGENYIEAQIASILTQLSQNDELIVSDDYSTDKTLDIVKGLNDERIKIVVNKQAKGYSGNFENAISCASGDFIFLSDQDDIWLDGKVEKTVDLLNKAELVVSNAQFVDKNLNVLPETFFSLRGGKQGLWNNLYKSRYLGACMAFRREIFSKLLPFPKNRCLCPHDLWITLVGELYFKVKTINEPLILYRRHDKNVSSGGGKSENSLFRKIFFRGYSLLMALSRITK